MNKITSNLLTWYDQQKILFPWRGGYINAYQTWISEIMLQQTQIKTVIPYYINWMKKFPTIKSINEAKLNDILKAWEGLGYYHRAHNIYKTAHLLRANHQSKIPNKFNKLIYLNGIGDYTASAILAIAFNKPYVAIDGNLKRIISRMFILPRKSQQLKQYKLYLLGC